MPRPPVPRTVAGPASPSGNPPGAPEHYLPDVFFLVLLCDRDIPAVGFQFMLKNPPESVVLHTERVVQHGGDVVLSGKLGQKMNVT